MLKKRLISALLLLPLLVVFVWFDQPLPWLTLFVAIWGVLAALEFFRIVAASKTAPLTYLGLIWTLLLILSPHFDHGQLTLPLLTSFMLVSLIWLVLRPGKGEAFTAWAWTLAGILYVGWFLSHIVALRGLDFGREWVLFALFVTFVSDSAAYFIGRTWGRHYLAPGISPQKTWEGAVAGAVAAIIIGPLLVWLFGLPIDYGPAVILALAVSIFGQFGDLVESLFKRNMGTKDSGETIPGHGGFLDRMDSIVFAGIVVYYYVLWIVP